jgi:Flp pilus assembly protein TadG
MLRRFAIFRRARRDGQRGAAALEFALATFVLVPLMLGIIDYAYTFYISLNVTEAQHAGLIAAKQTGVTDCSNTASTAQQNLKATAQTNATTAVASYFSANGLTSSVVSYVNSSNSPGCAATPLNPTWSMTLVVDIPPLLGRLMPWDKAGANGKQRYTAKALYIY